MAESAADALKTADKAAADEGGGGTMLDKVLGKLDSLHKRMDDFEKSKKADEAKKADGDLELKAEEEKGKEAAGENKSVTDKKRKDSAAADASKKADWDDEDEKKGDALPPQFQKDSKRKDEFPPDDDEDKKGDKRKDAKSKADEGKGEDEQEKEIAKGDARADGFVRVPAADWHRINEKVASIDSFVNRSDEDRATFADAQSRADSIYGAFNKRAPANMPGERLADYKRRLVTPFRRFSPAWAEVKMSELPDQAFENIENLIYADAMKAAENPPDLGEGELRRRDVVDRETGSRKIEWIGKESFIKGLSQPARRVAGFRNRHVA